MAKKCKEKEEKTSWLDYKFVIIILIIVVIFLLLKISNKAENGNYWVDGIHLEEHSFYEDGIEKTKATLYFNLFSDKQSDIKEHGLFSETLKSNKLPLNSKLYFKCHNKVYDEFYYFSVYNHNIGLSVTVKENGPLGNSLSNYNNYYEIQDSIINENVKEIDYCVYLGMIK